MKVTEVKIKREEFSRHRYLQYNSMIEKYAKVTQQYLVAFTDFILECTEPAREIGANFTLQ